MSSKCNWKKYYLAKDIAKRVDFLKKIYSGCVIKVIDIDESTEPPAVDFAFTVPRLSEKNQYHVC
jgi:hypothetical protein